MELSTLDLEILRNFAKINSNLAIFPGKKLSTVADSNQIAGFFESANSFSEEAGIYDLGQFLSVLGLFEKPQITQAGNRFEITDASGRKTHFFYAATRTLKFLQKEITLPETDVTFDFKREHLQVLKKAANTLGVETLVFESKGDGILKATVLDLESPTSNSFSLELSTNIPKGMVFSAIFEIKNLLMPEFDWTVEFSKKRVSRWSVPSLNLFYVVAMHKNSNFGETA